MDRLTFGQSATSYRPGWTTTLPMNADTSLTTDNLEPTSAYIGRLAPSPTGLLHLGHARTFLLAHDRARAASGQLLLRIDDLDPQRSKEHFVAAARADLRWLGLSWTSECRQSERLPLYRAALDQLLTRGLAYPCTCTRRDLQQAIAAPHEDTDDEPVYNGRCRPRTSTTKQSLQPGTNYRFRVPDDKSDHLRRRQLRPTKLQPRLQRECRLRRLPPLAQGRPAQLPTRLRRRRCRPAHHRSRPRPRPAQIHRPPSSAAAGARPAHTALLPHRSPP